MDWFVIGIPKDVRKLDDELLLLKLLYTLLLTTE